MAPRLNGEPAAVVVDAIVNEALECGGSQNRDDIAVISIRPAAGARTNGADV